MGEVMMEVEEELGSVAVVGDQWSVERVVSDEMQRLIDTLRRQVGKARGIPIYKRALTEAGICQLHILCMHCRAGARCTGTKHWHL